MINRFFRIQRLKKQLKKLVALPFILIGLVLLFGAVLNMPAFSHVRERILFFFTPVTRAASFPVQYLRETAANISAYLNVFEENKQLKAENETLKSWQRTALKLSFEKQELSKLLNYRSVAQTKEYVVRLLIDYNSPFSQSVIIKGGRNIGLKKGNVLVSKEGLYGIVQSVAASTARALKVTDYYARLPVYVGEQRYLALMSGDNSRYPHISALPEEAVVRPGDYIMTSGTAGVYPSGIPVGVVKTVQEGEITVDLFEKSDNLEFVRVIDYGSTVLLPDSCAEEPDP